MSSVFPWRNPRLTLGERCVMLAHYEFMKGVRAPRSGSNTSFRISDYLRGCVRDVGDDQEFLGLTAGNWCAAFASFCLFGGADTPSALLPGETPPHGYRASVVEIVADAEEQGRWHPANQTRFGYWFPSQGDLAIWDRSDPDRPETSWWRHVNRFTRFTSVEREKFITVGGNEGRQIQYSSEAPKNLDSSKLLGFVSYSKVSAGPRMTQEDREYTMKLVAAFNAETLRNT